VLGPDVPGVSLNLDCTGSGSPTVILDSGLGVPAIGWYKIQPEVAKFTRVCSYDRAGYGWSTAGPMPRTSEQIVKELHAMLAQSGEKPPYVFAAHSFGGYNVRVYKAHYPQEVAGLVLVDTSHEDQVQYLPPGIKKFMAEAGKSAQSEVKLAPVLIHSGFARLMSSLDGPEALSMEMRKEFRYLQLDPKFVAATASEMSAFDESAAQVRRAGNLGSLPLIVLTAGKSQSEGLPPTLDQKELASFQDLWIHDLQVRETHLSTQGRQIVVTESTHMIPMEQPQPVIEAIREVVEKVRTAGVNTPATR
jgi:pimeloyl-ACP methyl ester carboxylesterase